MAPGGNPPVPFASFLGRIVRRRLRIRLRSLMIGVALAALPLAIWANIESRRVAFLRASAYHRAQVTCQINYTTTRHKGRPYFPGLVSITNGGRHVSEAEVRRQMWHLVRSVIYERAAQRPWMPVEPDPPWMRVKPAPVPPHGDEIGDDNMAKS